MSQPEEGIRYLAAAEVARLVSRLDVPAVIRQTLLAYAKGAAGMSPEAAVRWTTGSGHAARSLILPGWADGSYGCKIINASLGNVDHGLPRAAGLVVLSDPETARPVCIMEGARISALRTAATSVVAIAAVREPAAATRLAILGCGRQSETHLELLAPLALSLREVRLFDLDPERARRFATRCRNLLDADKQIRVTSTAREAVEGVALTVAATTTTEPYVDLDWLSPGGTFVNVSLDDATEGLLLGADHLIVDDWELVRTDEHRLLGRLAAAGRVVGPDAPTPDGSRRVDTEIPRLLAGEYTRPVTATDRLVINPFGMGVSDIGLAAAVLDLARQTGDGTLISC